MTRKERTVLVAVVINLVLVAFKFWLAGASGSLALRASALHSVADLAIGLFVFVGLVLSRREAAARLSVIENGVALAVAAAIFYVGVDIVREVLLGATPELRNLGVITLAASLTVVVAWVVARYKLYVGRATDSPALIASGYHSRMDIYASIVVVAGLGGAALGIPNLDTAAAAVVVVLIFISGYQIASAALAALRKRRFIDIESSEPHLPAAAPGARRRYGVAVVIGLGSLYVASGLYVVAPGEAAVVRSFGAVAPFTAGPGLHYRWPWPVGREDIVGTRQVRQRQVGPSLVLTGDNNLVSVRLSVHYRVSDAKAFLLATASPDDLVELATRAAMRRVVGGASVDALLTTEKSAIEGRTSDLVQEILNGYGAGLAVAGVQLLESGPPAAVANAFRDVASAHEDRNTFINEAVAYRNQALAEARGQAARVSQSARAYSARKVASASAEAAAFAVKREAYARAPVITRERLYLEAMERVLPGARKFIVDPSVSLRATDLWIPGSGPVQPFPPRQ